jgi:excisionase family DNA binding protein
MRQSEGKVLSETRINSGAARRSPQHEFGIPPRLLSLKDAATYCGVSYWTVREWVDSGFLPAYRLPAAERGKDSKLLRVAVSDLDAFIDSARLTA